MQKEVSMPLHTKYLLVTFLTVLVGLMGIGGVAAHEGFSLDATIVAGGDENVFTPDNSLLLVTR